MLQAIGGTVPPNTDHAVSVSLPTWQSNVGYEEGEDWVVNKMECGYPRFMVHPLIQSLVKEILKRVGNPESESATLFPSLKTARICQDFLVSKIPGDQTSKLRIVNFVPSAKAGNSDVISKLYAIIYPKEYANVAKQVWQHSGHGISSRRGEFCLNALKDGYLVEDTTEVPEGKNSVISKGPRRYQQKGSALKEPPSSNPPENREYAQFIEERFGRNLSSAFADDAKRAVRRRIAGSLTSTADLSEALESQPSDGRVAGLTEDDVFLFATGMTSIFSTHQNLLSAWGGDKKSICFGFPYTDTLKILQKWGAGCLFYGHGSDQDLDDLEKRLEAGERFLALFAEFPGNPLLKSPDLKRIHDLGQKYDFVVVVDETVGNFINVNVLPLADVVVSSLTKIFSGDSNVMGGSAVLNPHGRHYQHLKKTFQSNYEDNIWVEDAVFLERNSRDFVARIEKINKTTEFVADILKSSPLVKEVYYPKYSPTKHLYDACRHPNGGYGGLFSVTFHSTEESIAFFDTLEILKGPSLGTNFTLGSPYTLLAHYNELPWASSFDVPFDLVRVSVGLEEPEDLANRIRRALEAVKQKHSG